jgi:ferritin-like metal-binding protein YciE
MPSKTLDDLFLEEIKDLYDSEKRLTKALPKLAKASTNDRLRGAFESHLAETQEHVRRLEQIFKHLDKPARAKKCPAMVGIVEEGAELIKQAKTMDSSVVDAGLICGAQKAEHYEIAAYGTLATWSEMLGHNEVTDLLEQTLAEEKAADEKLTAIASEVNVMAEATVE